ncbi:MAG: hypothetical protein SGPRY_013296 [Prymnesium sp.]
MAFLPVGPATRGTRPERFCHLLTIWVLIVWNLCLQLRSASSHCSNTMTHSGSLHSLSSADLQFNSFVNPSVATATAVTNFTVCSGCTLHRKNSTPANASDLPSHSSLINSSALEQLSPNTSHPSLSPPANTSSAAAASVWPVLSKSVLPNASRGLPPAPAGLATGAQCSSGFKGDSITAECNSFCQAKYARAHCARCKCRACDFCFRRVSGSKPSSSASSGGSNRLEGINQSDLVKSAATTSSALLNVAANNASGSPTTIATLADDHSTPSASATQASTNVNTPSSNDVEGS